MSTTGALIAVFAIADWAYAVVERWAAEAGHEIGLLVTLAPPVGNLTLINRAIGGAARSVIIVPTLAACLPTLTGADVDLGLAFTFPVIGDEVARVPRAGMVNLHPALLPAHRGPNGFRALYEGAPALGATLHRLTAEIDSGRILAQASEPLPADVDSALALAIHERTARAALDAGMPLALAGAPGTEQDSSAATFAPRFTEQDAVLDLGLTALQLQCRCSALVLSGIQPLLAADGERLPLRAVRRLPTLTAAGPGLIHRTDRRAIAAAADGVLELELGKLPF
jgi:methionyl-tRNA formyltransferase